MSYLVAYQPVLDSIPTRRPFTIGPSRYPKAYVFRNVAHNMRRTLSKCLVVTHRYQFSFRWQKCALVVQSQLSLQSIVLSLQVQLVLNLGRLLVATVVAELLQFGLDCCQSCWSITDALLLQPRYCGIDPAQQLKEQVSTAHEFGHFGYDSKCKILKSKAPKFAPIKITAL